MHGVNGGKNQNVRKNTNDIMDLPPDVPIYIMFWVVVGVVASIIAAFIPPSPK